jgi:manganese-transporting P-type ATPase
MIFLIQFKLRLTLTMIGDVALCWVIEIVCKYLFADLAPKAIVTRGRERREARRAAELKVQQEKERIEKETREAEQIRELEKQMAQVESRKNR